MSFYDPIRQKILIYDKKDFFSFFNKTSKSLIERALCFC